LGGKSRVQPVDLNDIYLGSKPGGSQDVCVLEQASGPAGLCGLLGAALLKARPVSFDPEHRIFGSWPEISGAGFDRSS